MEVVNDALLVITFSLLPLSGTSRVGTNEEKRLSNNGASNTLLHKAMLVSNQRTEKNIST